MAVSQDQIRQFVEQYKGDPEAIRFAANRFGVSLQDIQNATGYQTGEINNWLSANNLTAQQFPGQQTMPAQAMQQPQAQPAMPGGFGQSYNPQTASNPYLSGMADDIQRRSTDMMNAGIRSARGGAIAAGGFGGSAQGIMEGKAISGANDFLTGNLAQMYGGAYNADANRGLQRYGMDQGFYTDQRGQDMQQLGLGAQLASQGLQMPWQPIQNANSTYGNYTGYGQQTSGGTQGGGWQGALGGALGAGSFAKNAGWW